ncbi:myb-binding protein 1A [Phlebotomus argentipes]|uniref:myb-binding protein 1A n=1 Tax=Phlebotomus argentipes TaxID=94469 RepID=UPI002893593E|nr:myb-binding protein 1A [Phlebotomus argentipes]
MHVQHSEEASVQKVQQIINPAISRSLHQLLNTNENVRIESGVSLVQQLLKNSSDDEKSQEHKYVLKRLVRGTGGSSNASKCGFYTALVGYLNAFKETVALEEIFEVLDSELKVSKKATTKENADAYIGHVLVVTALQKCGLLTGKKKSQISKALEYVLAASQQKTYHYKLSYNCLIAFLTSQTEEEFRKTLLPFMRNHLKTPWESQTMNSLHFLMEAHSRFPSLIDESFLEEFLGTKHILDGQSFEKIFELFWKDKPETEIMQPAYDALGKHAAKSKNFGKFWTFVVEKTVEHPNRAKEVITVKLATDALNCENLGKSFTKIFSEKFLEMVFNSLRQTGSKDEVLKAVYLEFFEALFEALKKREDKQMIVLKKLVTHPGTLLVDKYHFANKIFHKTIGIMNEANLKELTEYLKNVVIEKEAKNAANVDEKWLNSEKMTAVQILQRVISARPVAFDTEWKLNQAKFILNIAIFYSNDGETVVKKPETSVVPIELANYMMNLFYHSLETSFSTMESGRVILSGLADHCNTILSRKNAQKHLRRDFSAESLKMWEEMYATVSDLNKKGEKFLVFQVLLLSMGLQLFRDAEMAESSLKELQSCVVRAAEKKSKLKSASDEEPEWIEVLMDLILHLLSQGSSVLRNIIKKVFPSLCPKLNVSAIYQILGLLDMKDGQNPLKYENEQDSSEESDDEDAEDVPKVNGKGDESGDESEDETDEEDEVEDEGTVSDKLRLAVSSALGFKSADSDQESVNLDDMTEEEGQRLDDALSTAFKMFRENKPQRKTKKDHREDTTLVHFRNRLIDLLVIYLKNSPELSVTLEIIITLYDMLPYCVDEESKPLLGKIEEALTVLVDVRNFRNDGAQVVDSENLLNALTRLCRKNENPQSMEVRNSFVVKGVKFILFCCSKISASSESIEKALGNFLEEFINSRNPTLNYTFFTSLFNGPWNGLWNLSEKITGNGLTTTTRAFRRIQSFDLLCILYKNHRVMQQNVEKASEATKHIEGAVNDFLKEISSDSVSPNEFKSLTSFLWEIHRCHRQFPALKSTLKWKEALEKVQEIRMHLQLDAAIMNSYSKLCSVLGGTVVKNTSIQKPQQEVNGVAEDDDDDDEAEMESTETNGNSPVRGKKRKMQQQKLKAKKSKKEARLKASNEGLGDGINFAQKIELD